MTAELDYAFLAEWARVNLHGTLDAIDASFLRVHAPLGGPVALAVAGRIRFLDEPYSVDIAVEIDLGELVLNYAGVVVGQEATAYGDGRRHGLFALSVTIPALEYRDVAVRVLLDGELQRTLVFALAELPEG